MKIKTLKGFGVDVCVGDLVCIASYDTGYFGSKGPTSSKEKGVFKILSFQLRGYPKMIYENSKGEIFSCHYHGTLREFGKNKEIKPTWYKEFSAPTKRQIIQYKKTRAKYE